VLLTFAILAIEESTDRRRAYAAHTSWAVAQGRASCVMYASTAAALGLPKYAARRCSQACKYNSKSERGRKLADLVYVWVRIHVT
jgi:hypothetical protein